MKNFVVSAILVILLGAINASTSVFAHNVSDYGSEKEGWVYSGQHAPTQTQRFFFVAGTSQTWKDRWNAGISAFRSESGYYFNFLNVSALETNN